MAEPVSLSFAKRLRIQQAKVVYLWDVGEA
jgi:hypothetical protein